MGAYAYCQNCDHSLPAPWNLDTETLLQCLFNSDFIGVPCPGCHSYCQYYKYELSAFLDELAERIDKTEG